MSRLTTLQTMTIQVRYHWEDLRCKNGDPYSFPSQRGNVSRRHLDEGGIYRWVELTTHGSRKKRVCLYVGEARNLYNRLYGYLYRSKSQATSYRIGRGLRKFVRQHKEIRFQLLVLSPSTFARMKITQDHLNFMHVRRTIEHAIIFREKENGGGILNR